MKSLIIKNIALSFLVITGSVLSAASGQELENKQKEIYSILSEYWIDKTGEVHLGNKNPKEIQFAFSESLLPRMTVKQIEDSMNAAIAKFDSSKKDVFKNLITPYLTDLNTIQNDLKKMRDDLDKAAATLAQYLGKTPQDIMKMADANIRNLISRLPQDKKVALNSTKTLRDLIALRSGFNMQTVEGPILGKNSFEKEETEKTEKTKSSKTGKISATVDVVAKTAFKLADMAGFVGETIQYSMCRDRHFDIVLDNDGFNFISKAD